MTTYFDKERKKWRYSFMIAGERFANFAIDPTTKKPAKNKRAADRGEEEARATARKAPKGPKPSDTTLAMVIADLSPEWALQARAENVKVYVREIAEFFGPETPATEITQDRVNDCISHLRTTPIKIWAGGPLRDSRDAVNAGFWKDSGRLRTPSTVNLYLEILRNMIARIATLRDQATRELIVKEPPTVKQLKKPKRKARPVPDSVLSVLMTKLPQHTVEALTASLYFGFRRGEIFALTIADVDFEMSGVRFHAESVKDNEDEFVPGAVDAMAYMQRLVEQARARGQKHLITYRRRFKDAARQAAEPWRPIKKSKGAWTRVMKEIEKSHGRKWRWHDIRAAFITQVAKTAGPLAAQTMGRHSDYATTQLYVEAADDFRRAAADKVGNRPSLQIIDGGKSHTQDSHPAPNDPKANVKKAL